MSGVARLRVWRRRRGGAADQVRPSVRGGTSAAVLADALQPRPRRACKGVRDAVPRHDACSSRLWNWDWARDPSLAGRSLGRGRARSRECAADLRTPVSVLVSRASLLRGSGGASNPGATPVRLACLRTIDGPNPRWHRSTGPRPGPGRASDALSSRLCAK